MTQDDYRRIKTAREFRNAFIDRIERPEMPQALTRSEATEVAQAVTRTIEKRVHFDYPELTYQEFEQALSLIDAEIEEAKA